MLTFLDKIPFGSPKTRRLGFWGLTAFLLYVIVGFFVVPPVVESIVIDQCTTALNRQTSIEKVYFNPLTLRLEVHELAVDKLDGEGSFIAVRELDASPSLSSIWKLAPVVSYLHLRDFWVDVAFLGDGKYSFSDLIGSRSEEAQEKDEEDTEYVFPFALYGFEMTNATIVFDDRPHNKKHTLEKMDLIVPFTSSFLDLRKKFTQPKFSAVFNGDPIDLNGKTLPFDKTLLTKFELGAMEIDLNRYWDYLPVNTPLELVKGKFTSDISLYFERLDGQRLKLFIGGGGQLTDLELSVPDDGKVLALDELQFEMEKYSLGEHSLSIKKVQLDKPYFKLIRRKNGINWAQYFPGSEITQEGAKVQTADDSAPLLIDIQSVEVADGILDWDDRAVPTGFKHIYDGFNLKCSNFTNRQGKLGTFTTSIGTKGVVKAEGNLSITPLSVNATVNASNFKLPLHTPYLNLILPVNVDAGVAQAGGDIRFLMTDTTPQLSVNKGTFTLSGVKISKPEAKDPTLTLKQFALSDVSFDLQKQAVSVGELRLTEPVGRLVREKDGQIDMIRLFASQPSETPSTTAPTKRQSPTKESAAEWSAAIRQMKLTDGSFSFRDESLRHPATVSLHELTMTADGLSTRKGEKFNYSAQAKWGKNGALALDGTAALSPLKADGKLKVNHLALRPFDSYLADFSDLLFASGTASADVSYAFSNKDKPRFSISGNSSLNAIQLKDSNGHGELAAIKAFQVSGVKFSNEPYRLKIGEIHLNSPKASVNFDENGYSNIHRALRIPPAQQAPQKETDNKAPAEATVTHSAPPEEKPFFDSLTINRVTMKDGKLIYRDASVKPIYFTKFTDIRLGLIDIRQEKNVRPKLDFHAKIGPTPISVTGAINPLITPMYSNLLIAVNGMELVPLSPYTIEYLAYPIEKGRLYADVKFHTEDWVLKADNKFYVEQLVLGAKDKRPDAPNVPVAFGLALLQDSNGNMQLNLPIRGRLDDPNFHIGGIVFKAIAGLFVKALASPFSLIGSIFGGGSEDMDFVLFSPGRHTLDAAGLRKLETTIKALKERDRLKLEVDGVIDPESDSAGLIAVIFQNKLKQQKFESLSRKERAQTTVDAMVIDPGEYEEILFQAYKEEPDKEGVRPTTLFMVDRQPADVMEKFIIDRIAVTENDLNELALRRAKTVKEHILSREPSLTDRVFLLDRRKNKKVKGGIPKHRADLGIK